MCVSVLVCVCACMCVCISFAHLHSDFELSAVFKIKICIIGYFHKISPYSRYKFANEQMRIKIYCTADLKNNMQNTLFCSIFLNVYKRYLLKKLKPDTQYTMCVATYVKIATNSLPTIYI